MEQMLTASRLINRPHSTVIRSMKSINWDKTQIYDLTCTLMQDLALKKLQSFSGVTPGSLRPRLCGQYNHVHFIIGIHPTS